MAEAAIKWRRDSQTAVRKLASEKTGNCRNRLTYCEGEGGGETVRERLEEKRENNEELEEEK